MHKCIQRGLIGVFIAGGVTLVGATAANATDFGGNNGDVGGGGVSQSNSGLNLGSGNGVSLGAVSAPVVVSGNSVGGQGGPSSQNATTVDSTATSDGSGDSSVQQGNAAATSGGGDATQKNEGGNVASGNGISGPAVSAPIVVSGNTVGGGQPGPDKDRGRSGPEKSSTSSPTTVTSTATSQGTGHSSVQQGNAAATQSGGKGSSSGGDVQQSNQGANVASGNGISGPAVSAPIVVSGNSVGDNRSGGTPSRNHEKGGAGSSSTSSPTKVDSTATSTGTGTSSIEQGNLAVVSTRGSGHDQGGPSHDRNGKQSGGNVSQSNWALNLGSGNGIAGPTVSVPVVIAGNTVAGGGRGNGTSSTSSPTHVTSTATSTGTGTASIEQGNLVVTENRGGRGHAPQAGDVSQSNEGANVLSGNGVSLGAVSAPVVVSGNTLGGGKGGHSGDHHDQWGHQPAGHPAAGGSTVTSTATSTGTGSSSVDQGNIAVVSTEPSHRNGHDSWKHDDCRDSWKHDGGHHGAPAGDVTQSNEGLNLLSGNGVSLGAVSAPVVVSGNTLGGGSGSSTNPTAVTSKATSTGTGTSSIDQGNLAFVTGGRHSAGDVTQTNEGGNVLSGNGVSLGAVSAPFVVSGNSVGGSDAGHGHGSTSHSPTTVTSKATSTGTGTSTIDQGNLALIG